mmetsp:Transcript_30062/g.75871  ORF Transcript_30062/g.75871 Transcript_30062/m.75871 type:complete len:92 (-) Transcript_30062:426-701(-)
MPLQGDLGPRNNQPDAVGSAGVGAGAAQAAMGSVTGPPSPATRVLGTRGKFARSLRRPARSPCGLAFVDNLVTMTANRSGGKAVWLDKIER